jgi:lipoprotein-anchoring transpeptidase ErfK/SrfK
MDGTYGFAVTWAFGLALAAQAALAAPPGKLAEAIENRGDVAEVRQGAAAPGVVRAQILLDRARFSPGQIDGRYGEDLNIAVRGYQKAHDLTPDGIIGEQMWRSLNADSAPLLQTYIIKAADLRGPFVPIPDDVRKQARMKWLGYESPVEGLAEKFHISPQLLKQLNPGKTLKKAGEVLIVPAVERSPALRAARVVVSKSSRTVSAYGEGDVLLAQYPATLGGEHDPLPIGEWKITTVQHNPWFNYDPVHFWNAKPGDPKVKLPPGPRNPAGVVWMGLSKPHYGIHGSRDPGKVRREESYGCIRLTNWDAEDLSHMVQRGTPAILEE